MRQSAAGGQNHPASKRSPGGRTNATPPAQKRFPGGWRVFVLCSGGVGPAPSRAALCSGCCPLASIPHTASPFRRFPTKARYAVFRGGPICPGKSIGEALEPMPGRDPAYSRREVPAARSFCGRQAGSPHRSGTAQIPCRRLRIFPRGSAGRIFLVRPATRPAHKRSPGGRTNATPPAQEHFPGRHRQGCFRPAL